MSERGPQDDFDSRPTIPEAEPVPTYSSPDKAKIAEDMLLMDDAEVATHILTHPTYRMFDYLIQEGNEKEIQRVLISLEDDKNARTAVEGMVGKCKREGNAAIGLVAIWKRGLERTGKRETIDQFMDKLAGRVRLMDKILARAGKPEVGDYTTKIALLKKWGDYERAVTVAKQGLEIRPNAIALYVELASAAEKIGDSDEALKAWESALKLDPDNGFYKERVRKHGGKIEEDERMRRAVEAAVNPLTSPAEEHETESSKAESQFDSNIRVARDAMVERKPHIARAHYKIALSHLEDPNILFDSPEGRETLLTMRELFESDDLPENFEGFLVGAGVNIARLSEFEDLVEEGASEEVKPEDTLTGGMLPPDISEPENAEADKELPADVREKLDQMSLEEVDSYIQNIRRTIERLNKVRTGDKDEANQLAGCLSILPLLGAYHTERKEQEDSQQQADEQNTGEENEIPAKAFILAEELNNLVRQGLGDSQDSDNFSAFRTRLNEMTADEMLGSIRAIGVMMSRLDDVQENADDLTIFKHIRSMLEKTYNQRSLEITYVQTEGGAPSEPSAPVSDIFSGTSGDGGPDASIETLLQDLASKRPSASPADAGDDEQPTESAVADEGDEEVMAADRFGKQLPKLKWHEAVTLLQIETLAEAKDFLRSIPEWIAQKTKVAQEAKSEHDRQIYIEQINDYSQMAIYLADFIANWEREEAERQIALPDIGEQSESADSDIPEFFDFEDADESKEESMEPEPPFRPSILDGDDVIDRGDTPSEAPEVIEEILNGQGGAPSDEAEPVEDPEEQVRFTDVPPPRFTTLDPTVLSAMDLDELHDVVSGLGEQIRMLRDELAPDQEESEELTNLRSDFRELIQYRQERLAELGITSEQPDEDEPEEDRSPTQVFDTRALAESASANADERPETKETEEDKRPTEVFDTGAVAESQLTDTGEKPETEEPEAEESAQPNGEEATETLAEDDDFSGAETVEVRTSWITEERYVSPVALEEMPMLNGATMLEVGKELNVEGGNFPLSIALKGDRIFVKNNSAITIDILNPGAMIHLGKDNSFVVINKTAKECADNPVRIIIMGQQNGDSDPVILGPKASREHVNISYIGR